MVNKKKILVITQEIAPYTPESTVSDIIADLPARLSKENMDLRIMTPKYGSINERRHRLHEVVRLSGINVLLNDEDFPLVIKVASLPNSRSLQCYFLDNDEYFYDKDIFTDKEGNFYTENFERMLFFCIGALETVKKFGWAPDYISCHGWMTGLIPMLVKTLYKNNPIFQNTKIAFTAYDSNTFNGSIIDGFKEKLLRNAPVEEERIDVFDNGSEDGLNIGGLHYADAITLGSPNISENVYAKYTEADVPKLEYTDADDKHDLYADFFKSLLVEEKV